MYAANTYTQHDTIHISVEPGQQVLIIDFRNCVLEI